MPREFMDSHQPDELEGSRRENKEIEDKKLSIVLARKLVEKITAREELDLNDYQRSCKYALFCSNQTDLAPPWPIGDLEGYLRFYKDLPDVFSKSKDKSAEIFFCGSKYDLSVGNDGENSSDRPGIHSRIFRTPDGIVFRQLLSKLNTKRPEPLFQIVRRDSPSN
jgi:hypothetical protein